MVLYRAKDYEDMSRIAANIMAAQVILKPDSVLGLATGSTPVGTYKKLIEINKEGNVDFSNVSTVNLDEYKGLSAESEQSYRYYMDNTFFNHINIKKENTFLPDGTASDPQAECKKFDDTIVKIGGIDLQLLGIGHNGHIGFNEPDTCFSTGTNVTFLTDSTIQANKRNFAREEDVPKEAYTMGIGAIMSADKILILISGAEKAEILASAFKGPVTPQNPASILQLHKDVTLVADEAALSRF